MTPKRFLFFWVSCVSLVLLTYNPFSHSFYHWVMGGSEELFLKLVIGLGLLFAYVFLIWVILGSVGLLGVVIGCALWGLLAHELIGLMAVEAPPLRRLVVLVCLATLLAVGLSWPHFKYRLHGQIEKRYLIKKKFGGTGI